MSAIKPNPQTPANCRYRTVMEPLCPTPGQHPKSMLNQALRTTEIRDYSPESNTLAPSSAAFIDLLAQLIPSARLQSP